MQGKRIERDNTDPLPKPGGYWRSKYGHWYGVTPNGLLVALSRVIEHEDGTITCEQSVEANLVGKNQRWHGYLTKGVWSASNGSKLPSHVEES